MMGGERPTSLARRVSIRSVPEHSTTIDLTEEATAGGVTKILPQGRQRAIGVDTKPVTVQSVAVGGSRARMACSGQACMASTYDGARNTNIITTSSYTESKPYYSRFSGLGYQHDRVGRENCGHREMFAEWPSRRTSTQANYHRQALARTTTMN